MPFTRDAEAKRIQYLRRQLRRGHSEKGREFTEEEGGPQAQAPGEPPFEIPLEEGDVKQDGVVLRGEVGREKLRGFQGDAVFQFGRVHCRLVELGAQAMLQLEPFSAEQMESLQTMLQNGFECKVLAVTKKAVVEARLNPNGKVRDVAADRIISAASLLTLRFTAHRFRPVEFLPVKVETQAPSEEENESEAEVRDQEPEAVSAEEELLGEWKMTVQGRTVSFDFVKNSLFTPVGPVREVKVVGPEAVEFLANIAAGPQSPGFHRAELQHIEGDLFCIHPKLWSQEVTRLRAAAEETAALDDDLDESAEKPVPAPAEESREIKEPEPVEEPAPKKTRRREDQRRVQGFVGEVHGGWLELFLDDEVCYDDARDCVVSGLLDGWVSDCEMIRGEEVTLLKELPEFGRLKAGARIRVQLPSLCWHKPMAEPSEKPGSDEGSTAVPETEEDTQTDGDVEIVEGLRVRRVGDWLELAARTLDEYEEALKILAPKLEDRTFAEHKLRWGENQWASELFEINARTGKLFQRKGRRSVNPEQARVRVRLSA
ncbi:unnamed protein product [Symbiodinium necroappetens]|uniref:Uncharacterized protein n=1 Tax=Symbiodinium necroappetens TaxID=1628268 RepID=A0A813BEE2_9DINO|nr:unnamed protein product [Symbiodinium necroappetens]